MKFNNKRRTNLIKTARLQALDSHKLNMASEFRALIAINLQVLTSIILQRFDKLMWFIVAFFILYKVVFEYMSCAQSIVVYL